MLPPPVSGGAVVSKVILVGQAPGVKEPVLARPFAWTAGKTLFGWFNQFCGMDEGEVRARIYFAAVCRCFPGKNTSGGDRVPAPDEIRNCATWMNDEFDLLRPRLVIPVGKLAISQFIIVNKLDEVIGGTFRQRRNGRAFDLIPLPHPSGASPWHRISPGKQLLEKAMRIVAAHPAFESLRPRGHSERSAAESRNPVA
ncbi:MAG: uracil-DNA glycosylase family protein [Chthoniobacterales bacterium]